MERILNKCVPLFTCMLGGGTIKGKKPNEINGAKVVWWARQDGLSLQISNTYKKVGHAFRSTFIEFFAICVPPVSPVLKGGA